jgi:hypothetical protein
MDTISTRRRLGTSSKTSLSASIVALFIAISGITSSKIADAADAVRVTTSFDVKYANAVLHQVTRLFTAGFGRAEADRVARDIDALKPDQPRVWQFVVQYQGKTEPFEIRGLMDDLGMIDLDFAASQAAAPAVRAAVDGYLNGRGH